jgi:hypothetical protein
MKTGISPVVRRFIEKHIVADDPMPERSWLDMQDMPRVQEHSKSTVAGLPVDPLPPLTGLHAGHGKHPERLRRRLRGPNAATRRGEG